MLSPTSAPKDDDSAGKTSQERLTAFKRNGVLLYLAIPFSQITGSYRLMNYKNFHKEVAFGLSVDAVLNMLCMLLIQAVNNSALVASASEKGFTYEFSTLQSWAVIIKFWLLALLIAECVLYLIELRYFNKMIKKAKMHQYDYSLNEKDKRKIFGKKYAIGSLVWFAICMLTFIIVASSIDSPTCRNDQIISDSNSSICLDCSIDHC